MIIAESFLWLHLPKTGGTSMNRLFRDRTDAGVQIDPDDTPAKHDSISLREGRSSWRCANRQRFITFRSLESWLISDWNHKRRHLQSPDLDFNPVRSGLFYSLRLGGTWVAADWWLHYFQVDHNVTALRLNHLVDDLNRHVLPLLPSGSRRFQDLPRENAADSDMDAPFFTPHDRERIAATNPRWTAWASQLNLEDS